MSDTPETPNRIIAFPTKKESVRPPEPKLEDAAPAPVEGPQEGEDAMVPYPDGILLRCSPKPGAKLGEFLVHDGAGNVHAAAKNRTVANFICEAVHVYLRSVKAVVAAQESGAVPPQVLQALAAKRAAGNEAVIMATPDAQPTEGK